ncbi:hypothetical protein B0H11DRAFT_2369593 [Mycena galericulata]|nr:hypothetical protein B0H11DRAFT_2369593 [Mycena galericulata]
MIRLLCHYNLDFNTTSPSQSFLARYRDFDSMGYIELSNVHQIKVVTRVAIVDSIVFSHSSNLFRYIYYYCYYYNLNPPCSPVSQILGSWVPSSPSRFGIDSHRPRLLRTDRRQIELEVHFVFYVLPVLPCIASLLNPLPTFPHSLISNHTACMYTNIHGSIYNTPVIHAPADFNFIGEESIDAMLTRISMSHHSLDAMGRVHMLEWDATHCAGIQKSGVGSPGERDWDAAGQGRLSSDFRVLPKVARAKYGGGPRTCICGLGAWKVVGLPAVSKRDEEERHRRHCKNVVRWLGTDVKGINVATLHNPARFFLSPLDDNDNLYYSVLVMAGGVEHDTDVQPECSQMVWDPRERGPGVHGASVISVMQVKVKYLQALTMSVLQNGGFTWGMRVNWLISSLFEKSLICDVKPAGGPRDPRNRDSEVGSTSKGCKSGMAGLQPATLLGTGMTLAGSPFSLMIKDISAPVQAIQTVIW